MWRAMWSDPDRLRAFRLDVRTLGRLWRFTAPHRPWLVLFLLLTACIGLLQVLPALVIQRLIDQALPQRDTRQLVALALTLGGLYLLSSGLMLAGRWTNLRISTAIIITLKRTLFDHLQRLPFAFFTRARTGLVQSRVNDDSNEVSDLLTDTLSSAVNDVLSLAFTVAAMLALSWRVTLAVIVIVPLVLVPAELVGRRARHYNRERMRRSGAVSSLTAERFNVAGALVVKLFGSPELELDEFTRRVRRLREAAVGSQLLSTSMWIGLSLAGSLAVVAIYWVGGQAVIGGALSLGTVVALATLAQRVYGPVVDLAGVRVNMVDGLIGFERVNEVLDTPPAVRDRPGARALEDVRGAVALEDVWFRYPAPTTFSIASLEPGPEGEGATALSDEPSPWILRGVDLHAEPGTMTALVGHTGAGKTTLCQLIPRLHDVTRGAVLLDGHDVRTLTLASVSRAVGVVPQDPHLFHDTIAVNLRFARPDATDADLARACRSARIDDLIAGMPDGYETIVGERGYRLSGGEKQRLAIARVLLKDPAVLILDEATSHLDSETEALIQEALAEVLRGRTSFVIAHRLSTVRAAHQIVVVEAGEVVERGRHEELLARGGLYADLHETQFRWDDRGPARD
ncbi:MAG: ABC transporter ATP-binding protein [Chloroflexi bacterium]|nr:MAG: ABC transporter ATP-binding protein [Chloroflexota bacterium]